MHSAKCGAGLRMMLTLLAAVLLITSCSLRGEPPAPGPEEKWGVKPLDPPVRVRIGEDGSISGAGFYIAHSRGYFKELGLDVEFVRFPSSPEMLPPLAAGLLDVAGGVTSVGLFNAVGRGVKIKAIADKGFNLRGAPYFDLVVRTGLVKHLNEFKDLKGLKVALSSLGTVDEIFLDRALAQGGLTRKDVTFVVVESSWDINHLLDSGGADAAIHVEPLIAEGEHEGILVRWQDPASYAPAMQLGMVLASPQFISEKTEVARRFMLAYLQGVRDYHGSFVEGPPAQEMVAIMSDHTGLPDLEVWSQVHPAGINPDGYLDLESLADQLDWYSDQGFLKTAVRVEDLVDHSLVDFAVSRLGSYQKHVPEGESGK